MLYVGIDQDRKQLTVSARNKSSIHPTRRPEARAVQHHHDRHHGRPERHAGFLAGAYGSVTSPAWEGRSSFPRDHHVSSVVILVQEVDNSREAVSTASDGVV